MSFRKIRSVLNRRLSGRLAGRETARLRDAAGHAKPSLLEQLERRQLLAFPDTTSAIALSFIGDVANQADTLDDASDEGWFSFTATQSDFVTVLADTLNEVASTLNTRLNVYVESLVNPGMAVPAIGANGEVLSGTGNGVLSAGTPTDGWVGFVAEAGTTYYVRVRTEGGTSGDYTLRIDRESDLVNLDAEGELQQINGNLDRFGQDAMYRFTTGSGSIFDSLVFVGLESIPAALDGRVEIFDASGTRIVADSDSGISSNAAAWFQGEAGTTYFIRVRSDEFLNGRPALGLYTIQLQTAAVEIPIDGLTRQGSVSTSLVAQAAVYEFTAAASGLGVITAFGVGLAPVPNPALRLFDSAGNLLAFNDNFSGLSPQISIPLVGGESYTVLFDGFSGPAPVAGTAYAIVIGANVTNPAIDGVDDHANTGDWDNATPLIFGTTPLEALPTIERKVFALGAGRIGETGDTDLFMFTPPRNMLGSYEGETDPDDDEIWIEDEDAGISLRPATRLQLTVAPGAGFLNTAVRVFRFDPNEVDEDSDGFVLVYSNNNNTFPDMGMSGSYDPAQFDPGVLAQLSGLVGENVVGIPLWGGQPYYIEVSGNGVGLYSLQVVVDAMDEDGTANVVDTELPDEGNFGSARFLAPSNVNGDVRFLNPVLNAFPIIQSSERSVYTTKFFAFADDGFDIDHYQQTRLPTLHNLTDTDMFRFTAPYSGTFEVRVNTSNLANSFFESLLDYWPDRMLPPEVVYADFLDEFYSSLLDSALRIYDNDFEQIAYNDDTTEVDGEFDPTIGAVGTLTPLAGRTQGNPFANFTFNRRDARVVFNVVAGQTYYIQVENGQRYKDGTSDNPGDRVANRPEEIDWRRVGGSYELILNGNGNPQNNPTAFSSLSDDHVDAAVAQGTVIPINAQSGTGTIGGIINTANDSDVFVFRASATTTATVTVSRVTSGGQFVVPSVGVFDPNGVLIGSGTATSLGTITLNVPVVNGRSYTVQVTSGGSSTGAYQVSIGNMADPDDYADREDFANAFPFPLQDFLGGGAITGSIESAGDTDVFRFEAFTNQQFTIRVDSSDVNLNPVVELYEITEDPNGNPFLARIAFDQDISSAELVVGVNSPRTSTGTGNTYNSYFIVVRGSDPREDFGDYTVTVGFDASDDHADAGEFDLATAIVINSSTGEGSNNGDIELAGDSDIFFFTAPASGETVVNVTVPVDGTLAQRVSIYDDTFTLVTSNQGLNPTDVTFDVQRGRVYYVVVEASTIAPTDNEIGVYALSVLTPPIDDHANIGELDLATSISLNATTGDARVGGVTANDPANPFINTASDTDLFTFVTLAEGDVQISVIPLSTTIAGIGPRIRVYDSTGTLIPGLDISASTGLETVSLTLSAGAAGERYYILVSAISPVDFTTTQTGEYALTLDGPPGENEPNPDPSVVDFANPTQIFLDQRADASVTDSIGVANERDLYTFTAPAKGDIYIQLITPVGSRLTLSLTVLNAANELPGSVIGFDSGGLPGVASNIVIPRSAVTAGQQFWVIVDGIGIATGSYSLRIDASPAEYTLYYPEGFSNSNVREVVSISNGGTEDVNFTVRLRYNDGVETIVRTGVIAAGTRSGATISNAGNGTAPGVRVGVPYAILITSDGPLGATLAHYDFGQSTGDSFTDVTSSVWTFARVEKNPGSVADALTVYNPNNFAVTLTLTAHTSSGTVVLTRVVEANSRGGWNINATEALPIGIFGATLTSAPVDAANAASHIGVVAGLTHYDLTRNGGYGVVAQPGQGTRVGALPSLTSGVNVEAEIVFYNPGSLPGSIVINGTYIRTDLPNLSRTFDIPARGTLVISASQLGLVSEQPIGITYTASVNVVALGSQFQRGEADATRALTAVGNRYFFGDAFINKASAGINYFETLNLYNPAANSVSITVRLLFSNGDVSQFTVPVGSKRFAEVNLHERPEILNRPTNLNYFSIELSATTQFGAQLTHYDLFLNGGYTQSGAPLGLLTDLVRIS